MLGLLIAALMRLYVVGALAVELALWAVVAITKFILVAADVSAQPRLPPSGELKCARGHFTCVEGGPFECEACGARYLGSQLVCANPECGATTPYISCAEASCNLMIKNPLRFGH